MVWLTLREKPHVTTAELALACRCSTKNIRQILAQLAEYEVADTDGEGWWWATEDNRKARRKLVVAL